MAGMSSWIIKSMRCSKELWLLDHRISMRFEDEKATQIKLDKKKMHDYKSMITSLRTFIPKCGQQKMQAASMPISCFRYICLTST